MIYKKFLYNILPPCHKCFYKKGIIKMVFNPCHNCKLNGYKNFEVFKKLVK